jgi:RNA polymerase sigma-70 factor (ECF subfamily)
MTMVSVRNERMSGASSGRVGHEPAKPALVEAFRSACASGDADLLAALLSDHVRVVFDSGGEVAGTGSAANGVSEALQLIDLALDGGPRELELRSMNGTTGLIARRNDEVAAAILLDADGDRVCDVWIVMAADKLAHWNRCR